VTQSAIRIALIALASCTISDARADEVFLSQAARTRITTLRTSATTAPSPATLLTAPTGSTLSPLPTAAFTNPAPKGSELASSNTSLVSQIGTNNLAMVTQMGAGNLSMVSQQGRGNTAIVNQSRPH
jgi:hypothetical protein